jgi:hypothetical protein
MLVSVNGVNDGTDYAGPYTILIDGTRFQSMCYDLADMIYVGEVWQANLLALDNLSASYFSNQPGYVASYQKQAWLFTQLLGTSIAATMIDIQHAAWSTFDTSLFPGDTGAATWRQAAQNAYSSGFPGLDLRGFRVVEAPGQPRVQGLIVRGFSNVIVPNTGGTPEPRTDLLLGTGILLLAFVPRRLRRWKARG